MRCWRRTTPAACSSTAGWARSRARCRLREIGLEGASVVPQPSIAVSFRSFDTVCGDPLRCGVEVADTALQQGQGMHGSFSRSDTWNFMAAVGPDFRSGFVDPAPSSNADVGRTIGHLMGLEPTTRASLVGRVLTEALHGGTVPTVERRVVASAPGRDGLVTVLNEQLVAETRYFDAAGFVGRTLGLTPSCPGGATRRACGSRNYLSGGGSRDYLSTVATGRPMPRQDRAPETAGDDRVVPPVKAIPSRESSPTQHAIGACSRRVAPVDEGHQRTADQGGRTRKLGTLVVVLLAGRGGAGTGGRGVGRGDHAAKLWARAEPLGSLASGRAPSWRSRSAHTRVRSRPPAATRP